MKYAFPGQLNLECKPCCKHYIILTFDATYYILIYIFVTYCIQVALIKGEGMRKPLNTRVDELHHLKVDEMREAGLTLYAIIEQGIDLVYEKMVEIQFIEGKHIAKSRPSDGETKIDRR